MRNSYIFRFSDNAVGISDVLHPFEFSIVLYDTAFMPATHFHDSRSFFLGYFKHGYKSSITPSSNRESAETPSFSKISRNRFNASNCTCRTCSRVIPICAPTASRVQGS